MAEPKTTAAKPAAAKKAATSTTSPRKTPAPKKASDPAPEPASATAAASSTAEAPAEGTAVIRFEKDKHRGRVRGAVNGQSFDFPVGSDVTVNAAQLSVLTDSGKSFTTVTPLAGVDADEGSSASTTAEHTATRLSAPNEGADGKPTQQVGEDGEPLPPHELRQITDADLTSGADQKASQEQAEGEGGDGPKGDDAAKGDGTGDKEPA